MPAFHAWKCSLVTIQLVEKKKRTEGPQMDLQDFIIKMLGNKLQGWSTSVDACAMNQQFFF